MIDLDTIDINYKLIDNTERESIKKYQIIPLKEHDIYLQIGSPNLNLDLSEIEKEFKKPIKLVKIDQKAYDFEILHLDNKIKLYTLAQKVLLQKDENFLNESYIGQFLDLVLEIAIDLKSSDIHIESLKNAIIFRVRVDGVLVQFFRFSIELYPIISSTIKLFSKLDIAQKRTPQNGRFSKNIKDEDYDFRVSILPIISGESIVIRVLDNKKALLNLDEVGFCKDLYDAIVKNINYTQGMILITGATGSGKTTTMYSILNKLDKKKKKIITIEDPIEYNIDGIMQVPINEEIGLSYEVVLKNILRQDPDVIMIGEIRDIHSLKIAIQAALTGHLVIATLHTNNAIKTINRLLDLEAKPYLIASVLRLIISQKLVRVLCGTCKEKITYDQKEIYLPKGCKKCNFTGYDGRTIVTEHFEFDDTISKMILQSSDITEIVAYAKYTKINENLYSKVLDGTTSLEEYALHEI